MELSSVTRLARAGRINQGGDMVATIKRVRRAKMTPAERFFWLHAGMSYDPKRESKADGRRRAAASYAADEAWLEGVPHLVRWVVDDNAERDHLSDDGRTDDGRPLWGCIVSARLPGDGGSARDWTQESLWGIDIGGNSPECGPEWHGGTPDPYCRVVAVDLAGELRAEAEKRGAVRTAYTHGTAQAIAAGILSDGDYSRCPCLADALEDAGHVFAGDLARLRGNPADGDTQQMRRRLVLAIMAASNADGLDEMASAYTAAALWSTNDEGDDSGGVPLDDNYGEDDLSEYARTLFRADCAAFLLVHGDDIGDRYGDAGHDFWLTRAGHGCGFWEVPDWPEEPGERMTATSKRFGEVYPEVGDDNQIHAH